MFISDTERKPMFVHLIFQVCFTAFIALFGGIYEIFSHGVFSYFMIYAFAIPLALGVIPYLFLALFGKILPSAFSNCFWNYGIVTLTLGSVMKGVLEIYGTDNFTAYVYLAGIPLVLIGLESYVRKIIKEMKEKEK